MVYAGGDEQPYPWDPNRTALGDLGDEVLEEVGQQDRSLTLVQPALSGGVLNARLEGLAVVGSGEVRDLDHAHIVAEREADQ